MLFIFLRHVQSGRDFVDRHIEGKPLNNKIRELDKSLSIRDMPGNRLGNRQAAGDVLSDPGHGQAKGSRRTVYGRP